METISEGERFDFGMNVLDRLFQKAFQDYQASAVDVMAFNVNLDYLLSMVNKYDILKKITIYSNTDSITYSDKNWDDIHGLVQQDVLSFCHIEGDKTVVHAKLYRFYRDGEPVFGAIGSPNLSRNSNQNFEFLYYIEDRDELAAIWREVKKNFKLFKIACHRTTPDHILLGTGVQTDIDQCLLEGLWAHQAGILKWMARRQKMVINIPPGCGKTRIAITYLQHLLSISDDITVLVLVPTNTLIRQWLEELGKAKINATEGGPGWREMGKYFGSPEKKAAVTLYHTRFFAEFEDLVLRLSITRPKLAVVLDECHNIYTKLDQYSDFLKEYSRDVNTEIIQIGLSATIDSFNTDQMNRFVDIMGGQDNIYEITLQSIYSRWNNKNPTPILKELIYTPSFYLLTDEEMEQYNRLSQKVAAQYQKRNIEGESIFSAAIERARWVRSLVGGVGLLKQYLDDHMEIFREGNTIIFVQTNAIAEEIRDFITQNPKWDPQASAYVYDSSRNDEYREYAMRQFRNNHGYCLIAEKMLSEGFDVPKISRVILHGSDRSERDWIQKVGRALRYDKDAPDSTAEIIDIVFCDPAGHPLPIETERFEVLSSVSIE